MVAIDNLNLFPSIFGGILAMKAVWIANFDGDAGKSVNTAEWNIITNVHFNNEVQEYTTSTDNLQLSGQGTLQIIPRKSESGQWTSGRIESVKTFTPADGVRTRFEAELRFGDAPADQKQGIWPAFWTLGESGRQETVPWPECGELDIMETKNGEPLNYATPHCGKGDSCGSLSRTTELKDLAQFHTYAIDVDRKNADWKAQTITWLLDGSKYRTVSGAEVADEATWASIAHSPMYFILNVAVGGDWPGKPNDKTADGLANMMEVRRVAVYVSNL